MIIFNSRYEFAPLGANEKTTVLSTTSSQQRVVHDKSGGNKVSTLSESLHTESIKKLQHMLGQAKKR
jgi:hypothetical protein